MQGRCFAVPLGCSQSGHPWPDCEAAYGTERCCRRGKRCNDV